MDDSFLLFAAVGFLAQLVDGALGMAYGVVSSTVLLSFGVSPAAASASVHAAEVFTTAASAGSHVWHRNIDWRLFRRLAPAGILGGIAGTFVLTGFDGNLLKPYVAAYLAGMGLFILWRGLRRQAPRSNHSAGFVMPLGAVGGTVDALGGGGWGPVVTTALVGTGGAPRQMIGTVNTVEFFVTVAISAAFVTALLSGHWQDAGDLAQHVWAVLGLVVGGVAAAPFAGYVTRIIPTRPLILIVGGLVTLLGLYQAWRLF